MRTLSTIVTALIFAFTCQVHSSQNGNGKVITGLKFELTDDGCGDHAPPSVVPLGGPLHEVGVYVEGHEWSPPVGTRSCAGWSAPGGGGYT